MDKRELGKALRESEAVEDGLEVRWSRNTPFGIQKGADEAMSLGEAYAIANIRCAHSGIPASATIFRYGRKVRTYFTDHAGRTGYTEEQANVTS